MGSFVFQEFVGLNGVDVAELMRTKLSQLPYGEANTARYDASDMTTKVYLDPGHPAAPGESWARGLVVWFSGAPDQPMPARLGPTWSLYTWRTDHDYESLYQGLVSAMEKGVLPDGRSLPPPSAMYSLIAYTNQMHGTATLTIFFRT
ncbi:MAG TPA: hypothetical protein VF787_26400 [Thermoanaerobaculia bacterium]